jgi:Ca2+-binding EF-hand superfamily protein
MEYNEKSIKIFFRNFADCLLENENKIIIQRSKLHTLYCFPDSFGYFKYLDKNQKNYIDIADLSLFISIYKIKCTKAQLNQILKKYDKDGDSCWNFSEYTSFINKDINIHFNNISNNLGMNESKLENYEKELVRLFELEINYMKYIGIKIKALKELINSKIINTKNIFYLIQKNQNKKDIDANTLISFLNDGNYHIQKEEANRIVQMISGGKSFFTEKHLDNIFKYDKYINNSELKYPKLNKEVENKMALSDSLKKYEGEFPMNDCGVMYYNVYNNSKEVKEKNIGNVQMSGHLNNNNIYNSFNDDNKNNFYNSFNNCVNKNQNDNILLNSNNTLLHQDEYHAFNLSSFSFK